MQQEIDTSGILGHLLFAPVGLSGRFSGCVAACAISQLRQILRCERAQHKKRIHTLGSKRPVPVHQKGPRERKPFTSQFLKVTQTN